MNRLRPFALSLCLVLIAAPVLAQKSTPPALQEVLDAKAQGKPVPRAAWEEVHRDHLARRAEARAALRPAGFHKDGGSSDADATPITSANYVDQGSTEGKGNNAALNSCATSGSDTAEDAWYTVTFTENATLQIWTTCENVGPPSHDTRLGVFDGTLNLIACNDDDPACGAPYYQSRITDLEVGPGTYYIVVDGWNGAEGPYELNVQYELEGPPCNGSDLSNPTVIGTFPYTHQHDSTNDCDDTLLTCELGGSESGPDHWYEVTFNVPVYLDVNTLCAIDAIDTRISIRDTASQQELYCNDDDPACPNGQSRIEDAHLNAGTYTIVVDGVDPTGGTYVLQADTTHAPPVPVQNLLPDIIVRESDLYDNDISTTIIAGRTHLRLSNATANIGTGKLHIFGGADNGDGTQEVIQRVYRDDGTWFDRVAGLFLFHPGHNHIHVEDWCEYRLRYVLPGDGVGDIVAKGRKTSFCVIDLTVYDSSLPGYVPGGEFNSCGSTIQGLSVGWADIYSKGLEGQNIDITGIADGEYWLESMADPEDTILESDETNNATRIKITLGSPTAINPDKWEPNDSAAELDSRPIGGPNSPNLGPVGPGTTLTGATVHTNGNEDWFRFYMPAPGTSADEVRIDFTHSNGNLDLHLQDDQGTPVDVSAGSGDSEVISLDGVAAGWYDVRIFGIAGATQDNYSLTINPSSNGTPSVTVVDPPVGNVMVSHGSQTYTTTWTADDPESNQTWVNIWANTSPVLDGNQQFLPTSQNTPGEQGFYIINTSYLDPDVAYWIYIEVTDGGTKSGAWSAGTITAFEATSVPELPEAYASQLLPAFPNPFNPQTTLRLQVQREGPVDWRLFDARGQLVTVIEDGTLAPGVHERVWSGRDSQGRRVASGVYFSVVNGIDFSDRQKVVLLK